VVHWTVDRTVHFDLGDFVRAGFAGGAAEASGRHRFELEVAALERQLGLTRFEKLRARVQTQEAT
jgi:hypothetical protein